MGQSALEVGTRGGFIRLRAIEQCMGRGLPPSAQEALATLGRAVAAADSEGIPREQARTELADAGVDPGEIDWLLEFLENRGAIYFVGDELQITEPCTR